MDVMIEIKGETIEFKDGGVNTSAQGVDTKIKTSIAEVRAGNGEVFTK